MRIKDWRKFQHYKHRGPPWIKLHRSLLNDREWFSLDGDASKMLANCWLLASEHDGELPDVADMAFRLRMGVKEVQKQIAKLDHWLEHDASTMLAPCKQSSTTETETETETEVPAAKAAVVSLEFEKFKKAYPKRDGGQGWPEAEKYFLRAVKEGCDAASLILAAEKYGKTVDIGSKFVSMARSWLSKRDYRDFLPTPEDTAKEAKIAEFMRSQGKVWVEGKGWVALEQG